MILYMESEKKKINVYYVMLIRLTCIAHTLQSREDCVANAFNRGTG